MKLLKKAGAVLLALAMIAVMIPQLGSKVVKAAEPSRTDVWNANNQADNSTVGVITAYAASGKTGMTTSANATDPDDNTKYTQGFKTQSSTYFKINVPEGKFVKVTVVATTTKETNLEGAVQIDGDANTNKSITANNKTVANKVVMNGYLEAGEHTLSYQKPNQLYIFKLIADVYDNADDVPKDAEVSKVKVSGTVKSSVSLTNGAIKFGMYEGNLTLKEGTTDEYTYELTDVEGDGTEYSVSIVAPEVTKGLKNIDPTSFGTNGKIQVEGSADKTVDFILKFIDLDGLVWNFADTSKSWESITYQGNSGIYKGLEIDATVTSPTAKFDVQGNRVQINEATKVKIPVSGWGTVICTFSGQPASDTTLGETTGDGKSSTMEYNYQNAEYVELSIAKGNTGLYLSKIEVKPDKTPAVQQLGASVRQETAEWGNGIRFGGQLDLTKVDKATCKSGTLIGLAATVGNGNEMSLEDVGTTCIDVVRTTYITETDATLEYAAALINIPNDNLDTKIVARPYVIVNEIPYYGEQIETTYNSATKVVNEQ